MGKLTQSLEAIGERIRQGFSTKDAARERALGLCREAIRFSTNAIRSAHRQEYEEAQRQLGKARSLLGEIGQVLSEHADLTHAGYVHDAQKEFAEGSITLALVTGGDLPDPEALGVGYAPYLNGMGEAVGELRRYLLDAIRRGDLSRCEELLTAMDDIYGILVTMDFPDALTGGLRRTTDMVRGVLEKTRGDLTIALGQKELEKGLEAFKQKSKEN